MPKLAIQPLHITGTTAGHEPVKPLCGYVEAIAPASGSEFALIPPDNATGNFTKITILNALVDRVMAQEENMRILLESAPGQGSIKLVNASTEKLFGYKRLELLERNVEVLVPDRQADMHKAERKTFLQKPEARPMGIGRDLRGRRKDGSEFPVEIGLNPIIRNGKSNVLATVIDISERKRAQQAQQMMIRELQHRTQNLFAVFQAIASRTADESRTAAEVKYVLNGRLQALARAYAMLAEAAWEGASLAMILEQQFAGFPKRVSISGCDIILDPQAAHQFALIIHELATNALKYGSLSDLQGSIVIEGRTERLDGDARFSFRWKELGGPRVSPPTRKGFGSVILLDAAQQFGRVTMNYAREGFTYELEVGLSSVEASKNLARYESNTTFAPGRADPFEPLRT